MATIRYAGDRFVGNVGSPNSDATLTGVLDGAYYINTGNLTQYVKRPVGGWAQLAGGGGGGGTPGGANTQVQFNNGGTFGGDADLTFTDGNRLNVNKLGISGNIYDSNNSLGEGGMVLTNEGQTGVNWKSIESVLSGVGGSGVANYVARWSDEDTITTGVLVDNATNVGIGTVSPTRKLEVVQTTNQAAAAFETRENGGIAAIELRAKDLSNPTAGLPASQGPALAFQGYNGSSFQSMATIFASMEATAAANDMPSSLLFLTTPDGSASATEKMRIKSDGKVGIGTNNPGYPLTVANGVTQARVDLTLQYLNDIDSLTNTDLGRVLFRAPYSGTGNNVGSITLRTGASAYRTDLRFKVKATGGSERQGIIIHGTNNGALVGIGQLTDPTFPFQVSASNLENGPAKRIALFFDETDAAAGTGAGIALGGYVGAGTDPGVSAINDFGVIQGIKENSTLGNYASAMRFLTRENSANPAEQMRITSAGSVGIGTTAPVAHLHVSKSAGTTTVLTQVAANSTVGYEIKKTGSTTQHWKIVDGQTINGTLEFYDATDSATRMVIKGDGNVGVGTNNPLQLLHVYQAGTVPNGYYEGGVKVGGSTAVLGAFLGYNASASGRVSLTNLNNTGGNNALISFGFGAATDGTPDTLALAMNQNGNVGVGTNVPLSKFNILGTQGNWRVDPDSVSNEIQVLSSNTANTGFRTFRLRTNETIFDTGGSERMRILSDGNVGIGTTAPIGKLHVYGGQVRILDSDQSPSYGARLVVGRDTAQDIEFHVDDYNCKIVADQDSDTNANHSFILNREFAGSGANDFRIQKGGGSQFLINTDGNVGINNLSPEHRLHVAGDAIISGYLYDSTNSTGVDGYVLTSKEDGPQWKMIEDVLSGVGGNGTANYIPKWEDEDTIGDSVIAQSGDAIGIGTAAPATKLHVEDSTANTTATKITVQGGSRGFTLGKAHTADNYQHLKPITDTAMALRVMPNGTTAREAYVEVWNKDFENNANSTSWNRGMFYVDTSSNVYLRADGYGTGSVYIGTENNTQTLTIQDSGNVGIGVTSANAKLKVVTSNTDIAIFQGTHATTTNFYISNSNATANNTANLYFAPANKVAGALIQAIAIEDFSTSANRTADLAFQTRKDGTFAEHMRIDSSGNVGIGTNNPTGKFQIGANYTIPGTAYGGDDIYIANTGSHANYDPYVTNTDDFRALITISDATTEGPTKPGLILYNDSTTAGGFSPMLLFAKRETGASPYKAATAAIYARSPLGTGNSNSWIDGELIFATAGAATNGIRQRMVINKEGLVGIGTNSPTTNLHIRKIDLADDSRNALLLLDGRFAAAGVDSGDEVGIAFRVENSGGGAQQTTCITSSYQVNRNSLNLQPNGGNVGIGTNNPSRELEVHGSGNVYARITASTDNDSAALELNNNGNELWTLKADDTANDYFKITNDAGTALTIDTSKNVGIGTTNPSTKLYVLEDAADWATIIKNSNANGYGLSIDCSSNTGTTVFALATYTGAGTGFFVRNKGNVGIGTAQPGAAKLDIYHNGGFTDDLPTARIYHRNNPDSGNNRVAALDINVGMNNGDLFHHGHVQLFQHFTGAAYNSPKLYFSSNSYTSSTNHRQWWGIQALANTTATGDRLAFTCDLSSTNPTATPVHIMSLLTNGRVGIGVAAPSAKLHVEDTGPNLLKLRSTSAGSANAPKILFEHSSGGTQTASIVYDQSGQNKLVLSTQYQSATDLNLIQFAPADNVAMTIRGGTGAYDGFVGIGTTSPDRTLDVRGNVLIKNTLADLMLEGNRTSDGVISRVNFYNTAGSDVVATIAADRDGANDAGAITFDTQPAASNNTERMRITSLGSVGIGTNNPQSLLHLKATAPIISLTDSNSFTDADDRFIFRAGAPDGGFFQWYDDSASSTSNLMYIASSGAIQLNTYGSGTHTGTPEYKLSVDSSGNIIETAIGAGQVDGSGTANTIPRWTDTDTIGDSLITVPNNTRVQINGTGTSNFEVHGQSSGGIVFNQIVNTATSAISNGAGVELRAKTTTQERQLSYITSRWLDNTDASRKSRLIITTQDGGTGYNTYQAYGKNPILAADSGCVGIGTTNPAHKLEVVDAGAVNIVSRSSGGNASLTIDRASVNDDAQLLIKTASVNKWRIATGLGGNDEKLTVYDDIANVNMMSFKTAVGVGVGPNFGTNEPTAALHVLGDSLKLERANNAPALKLYNNHASPADGAALGYLQFTGKDNDGTANMVYSEVRGGVQANANTAVSGYLAFLTTNNGTSVTEAMRIKADGSVGIATTNPAAKLDVSGNILRSGLYYSSWTSRSINTLTSGGSTINYILIAPKTTINVRLSGRFNCARGNGVSAVSIAHADVVFCTDNDANPQSGGIHSAASDIPSYGHANFEIVELTYNSADYYALKISPSVSWVASFNHIEFEGVASNVTWTNVDSGNVSNIGAFGGSQAVFAYKHANVGIGTDTPAKLLTVRSATSPIIGLYSAYADSNARNWSIGTNNAAYGDFTISASAANGGDPTAIKLSILKDGNVGIGTNNPLNLLMINGSSPIIRFRDSNATGTPLAYIDASGGALKLQADASNETASSFLTLEVDGSEHVRVVADGNVGIGTTTPDGRLHVSDAADFYVDVDGTDSAVVFKEGGGNSWRIGNRASGDKFNITQSATSLGTNVRFTIDDGGSVGIGTDSPTELLEVDGNIRLGDGNHRNIIGPTNATLGIYSNPNDSNEGIKFSTDAGTTIEMFLQDGGNVGIGTETPKEKLHVSNGSSAGDGAVYPLRLSAGAQASTAGDATGIKFIQRDQYNDYGAYFRLANTASNPSYLNPRLEFGVQNTNTNVFGSVSTKMVITGGGSVGIGTQVPYNLLHVNGTGRINSLIVGNCSASNTPAKALHIKSSGTDAVLRIEDLDSSNQVFDFLVDQGLGFQIIDKGTGSSTNPRLTIDTAGNVGIGTTVPGSYKLHVNGNTMLDGTAYVDDALTVDGNINFESVGQYITFYGNNNAHHSISSRSSAGSANDDIRINTYGALFINLDSNGNDSSESHSSFQIGRHAGTGAVSASDLLLNLSGETGKLRLYKYGSGTHTGTAAYKLSVDSSGNVIETAIGAGAVDGAGTANYITRWTDTDTIGNSNIFDNGTIGIGTAANLNGKVTIRQEGNSVGDNHIFCQLSHSAVGHGASIFLKTSTNHSNNRYGARIRAIRNDNNNAAADLAFSLENSGATGLAEMVRFTSDGSVGIGTTSPDSLLHVGGAAASPHAAADDFVIAPAATDVGMTIRCNSNSGTGSIFFADTAANAQGLIRYNHNTDYMSFSSSGDYFFDTSNGSVGIGTITPGQRLDVINGAIRISSSGETKIFFRETVAADTYADRWTIGNDDAINNAFVFSTGANFASPKLVILEGGHVGIGEAAPGTILHLKQNDAVGPTISLTNNSKTSYINLWGATGGGTDRTNQFEINAVNTGYGLTLASTDYVRFKTDGIDAADEAMRIDSDGSVGIGTTSPSQKLDVNGNVRAGNYRVQTGNQRTKYRLWDSSSHYGMGMHSGFSFGGLNDYALTLQMNNEADRGLWFGDSSQTAAQGAMAVTTEGKMTVAHSIRVGYGESDTTTPGATYRLDISGEGYITGNLGLGGTLTEASSLAIKENVETFEPSLDIINKIRPVKYDKKTTGKKEIGLIAEELAELFPELVEKDKNGNPSGVNYSRAVTVLLGGFKELYKEVQELKKRI